MQFYPHNVPTSKVYTALSSSLALSASLINNFSATVVARRVDTASVALNITGARGVSGTSVAVYGPDGDTGPRGVTGPRGNSVYLLSGSWHDFVGSPCSTPPTTCWEVNFYTAYDPDGGTYLCDFSTNAFNPTKYYTTDGESQAYVDAYFDTGFAMYQNSICTIPVTPNILLGANSNSKVYSVNAFSSSSGGTVCRTSL